MSDPIRQALQTVAGELLQHDDVNNNAEAARIGVDFAIEMTQGQLGDNLLPSVNPLTLTADGADLTLTLGGVDQKAYVQRHVCDFMPARTVQLAAYAAERYDTIAIKFDLIPTGATEQRYVRDATGTVPVPILPIPYYARGIDYVVQTGTPGGGAPGAPNGYVAFATVHVHSGAISQADVAILFASMSPTGAPGTPGTPGINGTGFSFRGLWDVTAAYRLNDVVSYNGSGYVATGNTTGSAPDSGAGWGKLVNKGDPGLPGADSTVPGPRGLPGNPTLVTSADGSIAVVYVDAAHVDLSISSTVQSSAGIVLVRKYHNYSVNYAGALEPTSDNNYLVSTYLGGAYLGATGNSGSGSTVEAHFKVRVKPGAGPQTVGSFYNSNSRYTMLALDGVVFFTLGLGAGDVAWSTTIPDDGAYHNLIFHFSMAITDGGPLFSEIAPWLPPAGSGGLDVTRFSFAGPSDAGA